MSEWYSSVYKGFLLTGVTLFVVGLFLSGINFINAYLVGYTSLIIGLLCILVVIFIQVQSLSDTLIFAGPIILMIGVICFITYLLWSNMNIIVDGHVSQGYYAFNTISTLLILTQIYIVYSVISSEAFESKSIIPKVQSAILYLLGVLSAISTTSIYIILKYFRTDGFTSIGLS
jgi:hypothetical protein